MSLPPILRIPTGRRPRAASPAAAFTVVELLVSVTILTLVLTLLLGVVSRVSNLWSLSSARIDAFQNARFAFQTLSRQLSRATLNPYLGYDNDANPQRYLRKSELKFFCGPAGADQAPGQAHCGTALFFIAPAGRTDEPASYGALESLLNVCGYYVDFTTDPDRPPHVASSPHRYRLMQRVRQTEHLAMESADNTPWYLWKDPENHSLAENIIALIIRPQDPAATPADLTVDYRYDSALNATASPQPPHANRLPPVLALTLIAIDEASARRLDDGAREPTLIANLLRNRFALASEYEKDLEDVRAGLDGAGISCRIFSGSIPIREATR